MKAQKFIKQIFLKDEISSRIMVYPYLARVVHPVSLILPCYHAILNYSNSTSIVSITRLEHTHGHLLSNFRIPNGRTKMVTAKATLPLLLFH